MKFFFILFFGSLFCFAGERPPELSPLNSSELNEVIQITRSCLKEEDHRRAQENLSVLSGNGNYFGLKPSTPGYFSMAYQGYQHLAYSNEGWKSVVAAARKMKELGWVYVSDSRKLGVIKSEKWEKEVKGSDSSQCHGSSEAIFCDDKVASQLSLATTGKSQPSSKMDNGGNRLFAKCFYPDHGRMMKMLLDNGYTYDKSKGTWEKDGATVNTGQGAAAAGSK